MSFDTLAPHYRWLEQVLAGNKLQHCRTAFLDQVLGSKNVLIAGEGNGRFLTECRHALPSARITVVDVSSGMLRVASRRAAAHGLELDRIEFVHSDILAWRPEAQTYDLVVTHFFLDCFPPWQLKRVVEALARSASGAATWLLADFQIPPLGWKCYRAKAIHLLMYAFFRAAARLPAKSLTPPEPFLRAQGFRLRSTQVHEWGLLHSDLWIR
jgi:ubiquinone/menaquinone biosynthesis C-methylase UbiE